MSKEKPIETISTEEIELRKELRGEIPGPVWPDGCDHHEGAFIASFELYNRPGSANPKDEYDLYVFEQKYHGSEVCIRYGKELNEYISPGGLGNFLQRSLLGDPIYARAAEIILAYGKVKYEKRNK